MKSPFRMLAKKRLGPCIGIVFVLICLSGASYYFLNKSPVVSAGEEIILPKEIALQAALARKEGKDIRNREHAAKLFREILNAPSESLIVEAILKGDSGSAVRTAKIWEMTEPGNPIAQALIEAFKRTRTCGNESCSVRLTGYQSNKAFNAWLNALRAKYPTNPHIALMTADGTEDEKTFASAIKSKDSNLDFNFGVELCSFWVGDDVTARLRKDWKNKRSIPAALRLTQRLTCCNDDFCATTNDGEEALTVLKTALNISSANDLESIRDAFLWAKARTTQ